MNDFRNFNEIFRKDVTYDNIKSYKKPESHPLFKPSLKETFLEKRQGVQADAPPPPPAFLGLKTSNKSL